MGCWDHPVHSKGIDQAQGPFRGSHQEQKETGPETGLETQLQHGPKSTQETGLNYLPLTKVILEKGHHTDGICSQHKVLVHILVQKGPLSLSTSKSARADTWTWWQHPASRVLGKAECPPSTLPGLEKLIQLLVSHREKKSSPLCCNHSNTPMLVLLALLTALTSANWFIRLPSPVGTSVRLSHEYLPGWDEASLPSGPDSIPLYNWFLKNLVF